MKTPSPVGVLLITLAIQVMTSVCALLVPVLAPVLAPVFGHPAELIGVYVSVLYVGAILGSLGSGGWIGSIGPIRVSQYSLLLCAAGLACLLFESAGLALVGALLVGLGYGPITPASSELLARATPPEQMGLVFSIKQTGVPLGGVVAGLLAPKVYELWGWQMAVWLSMALCLVCLLSAQFIRAALDSVNLHRPVAALAGLRQSLLVLFKGRAIRLLALSSLSFSAVQLSLSAYLVTYLHDSLNYSLLAAGGLMSMTQLAGVGGRLLWGWAADRFFGAVWMLIILALLMGGGGFLLALFNENTPYMLLLALLLVFGAAALGWNGVYLAEVARQAPAGQIGVATGGALATTFLGVVLGPTLFAGLAKLLGGYQYAFFCIVLPALCAACVLWRKQALFKEQ